MAIHVLASASGAPGVTTTALGLTLAWPTDVVLVDLDRDCSQAVLAGYLGGLDPSGCGLISAAAAYRAGGALVTEIGRRTLPLPSAGPRRAFLAGFTSPATCLMFRPLWAELMSALRQISEAGTDVIIDGGRVGPTGLPRELMAEAEVLALVTRSSLRALAGLRLHLAEAQELRRAAGRPDVSLILTDPDHPYGRTEIEQQFGVSVAGTVPHQPVAALALSDGHRRPHRRRHPGRLRPDDRALQQAYADLADRWHTADVRRHRQIQGVG